MSKIEDLEDFRVGTTPGREVQVSGGNLARPPSGRITPRTIPRLFHGCPQLPRGAPDRVWGSGPFLGWPRRERWLNVFTTSDRRPLQALWVSSRTVGANLPDDGPRHAIYAGFACGANPSGAGDPGESIGDAGGRAVDLQAIGVFGIDASGTLVRSGTGRADALVGAARS